MVAVLIYLLTAWTRVLLEELAGLQLVKKIPAFYGTRRLITAFASARHLSVSWAISIQSIPPYPTSWTSILILSSHLRLGLPTGLFPPCFLTKTLYTPLPSTIRATCPTHLILLDFITRTILGEGYRTLSSSLCSFLHSPVTSSLLGPNIFLKILFSNTLSLLSSLNVSGSSTCVLYTWLKVFSTYGLKKTCVVNAMPLLSGSNRYLLDNETATWSEQRNHCLSYHFWLGRCSFASFE